MRGIIVVRNVLVCVGLPTKGEHAILLLFSGFMLINAISTFVYFLLTHLLMLAVHNVFGV